MKLHLLICTFFCCTLHIVQAQQGKSAVDPIPVICNSMMHISECFDDVVASSEIMPCITDFKPVNGVWLSFTVSRTGKLGFDIIPDVEHHDIDFSIFVEGNLDQALRCNAGGPSNELDQWCAGTTGMMVGSQRVTIAPGCKETPPHNVSSMLVKAGARYLLFVHNFNGPDGFTLRFSEALTSIGPLDDKIVHISSDNGLMQYSADTDRVGTNDMVWSFPGSDPSVAFGVGPHSVRGLAMGWRLNLVMDEGCICELNGEASSSPNDQLKLWPNPVVDMVMVDLREMTPLDGRKLQVIDFKGGLLSVHEVSQSMEAVQLEFLSPGPYIIRLLPEGKYGLMVKM